MRESATDPRSTYHLILDGCDVPFTAAPSIDAPCSDVPTFFEWLESFCDVTAEAPDASSIDVLVAYAPAALVFGAWLAPLSGVRTAHESLGAACLDAYFLECGEGDAARHKGNLFRALLAGRGIVLPPHTSERFASDARFRDADFAWALAGLSLVPCAFARRAEVIGFHAAATVIGPPACVRAALEAVHSTAAPPATEGRAQALARRIADAGAGSGGVDLAGIVRGASRFILSRDAWERSFTEAPAQAAQGAGPSARPITLAPRAPFVPSRRQGTVRSLFHDLLTDQSTDASKKARQHVHRLLGRASRTTSHRALVSEGVLPWSRARFERWVAGAKRAQAGSAQRESKVERAIVRSVTRKEVVWLLTQLAPSAFTEGAWLEGVRMPGLAHTAVAAPLLRIHREELGAGVPSQHHGNVLRRTLLAQNVTLPACDSRDFSAHTGFVSEAFSMPVLWLSIARTTSTYLPELLGLNLAIEMAENGSGHELAIELLRRHEIDPGFFELHAPLDGAQDRAALCAEAISAYVDSVAELGDDAATVRAVERVFTGHAAYALASRPFTRVLAAKLGPRVALRLLRAGILGTSPSAEA